MAGPVIAAKLIADVAGFSQGMNKAGASLQAVGGQMLGVSKKAFALSAAITAVGALAVKTFADFENRMASVGVISGATGEQFAALEEKAKGLGATTLFTARQAADGMEILSKAGFSVNEILTTTPAVLNLATAATLDLGDAANTVIGIMRGYGKSAGDINQVNDVLVKTFTSTNVTVGDIAETMKLVGPIARTVGIEFEELSAVIGILGNANIKGTTAGTALRKTLIAFSAPTPKAAKQMKKLGLEVLDAAGNMRPLNEIIDVFASERGPALVKSIATIIGVRPAAALAALAQQGGGAIRELTAELKASEGTAKKVADVMTKTLAGSFTILKSKIEAVALDIGERFEPVLRDVTDRAFKFVDAIRALDDGTKNTILRIAAMTAGISALIGIFAAVAGAVVILVGALLLLAAPVAIVALLIALGGAFKLAWEKNLGGVQQAFAKLKTFIGTFFDDMRKAIGVAVDFWTKQIKKFSDFLQKPVEIIISSDLVGTPEAMDIIRALVTQGFRGKALQAQVEAVLGFKALGVAGDLSFEVKPFSDLTDALNVLAKARPDLFGDEPLGEEIVTGFGAALKDALKPEEIKNALKTSFLAGLKGLKGLVPPDIQKKIKDIAKELEAMLAKIGQGTGKAGKSVDDLFFKTLPDGIEFGAQAANTFIDALKEIGREFKILGQTILDIVGPKLKSAVTGLAGDVLKGGIEGGKAAGGAGAVVGVISTLLLASKTFQDIMTILNKGLQVVADLLGAFLEPLKPLIAITLMLAKAMLLASPGFLLLGIVLDALSPLFKIFFNIIRFFGIAILKIIRFFQKALRRSTKKTDAALKELRNTTFETAGDVDNLGDAANAASEALFNVPVGVKIAAARFAAQAAEGNGGGPGGGPGGSGLPGFQPPIGGPPKGQPPVETELPEGGGPLGTSEGAATAADGPALINIFVRSDDPAALVDVVEAEMERRGIAVRGIPGGRVGGQFTTRRGSV